MVHLFLYVLPSMSVHPSVHLCLCSSVHIFLSDHLFLSVRPSVSVCLSVHLCLCVSVLYCIYCICIYIAPFDSVHQTEALTVRKTEGKEGCFKTTDRGTWTTGYSRTERVDVEKWFHSAGPFKAKARVKNGRGRPYSRDKKIMAVR